MKKECDHGTAPETKRQGFWGRQIARNSVNLKLFATYLLLMLFLGGAVIVIFYNAYYSLVRQRVSESFSLLLDYVCAGVETEFDQLTHLSDYLFLNREIKDVLEMESGASLQKRQINKQVRSTILEYTNANYFSGVNQIIISDLQGEYVQSFYMNYTDVISSSFTNYFPEYVEASKKAGGVMVCAGTVKRDLYPNNPNSVKQNEIVFYRSIKDSKYKETIGVMYFAVDPKLFLNRMRSYSGINTELAKSAKLLLIDNSGAIVNEEDNIFTAAEIEKILQSGKASSATGLVMKERDSIVFSRNIYNGWHIIGSVPASFMVAGGPEMLSMYSVVVLLSIFVCMLAGFLSSRSIFRPMQQIVRKMRRIAQGETDLRIHVASQDEIGQLGANLNQMLDKIAQLNRENLEKELKMRDAIHRAQQAQINPHFIHNTLNGIRWMAMMMDADCIKNAVDALWQITKYNVSSPHVYFVPVRDEINILRQYISLQQLSYRDKFTVEWDIDERALPYACLKFFLQPIVENSILHGAYRKGEAVTVSISCYLEGERLVFDVYDTGTGIAKEKLDKIFELGSSRGHIGLANVRERLSYAYGDGFTFDISSEVGRYTNVMISLPLRLCDPEEPAEDFQ